MVRIITLNLNGIRSAHTKGFFSWLEQDMPDIVCVQELKAQAADMSPALLKPAGYQGFFHYAEKKGYSGVGIYCRQPPDRIVEGIGHPEFDAEGRFLRFQFLQADKISLLRGNPGKDTLAPS